MNLFKLTQDFLELENSFEETENLDYIQALEITKENIDNKIVSYDFVLNDIKAKEQLIADQIKRLQDYRRTLQNKQKSLKNALLQVLLFFGEDRKMTKAQKEKGLSRAGKKLEVVTENGRVLLSESIKQKPIFDPFKIEAQDIEYTVKLRGDQLAKLEQHDFVIVKQEEKPSADKVLKYEEISNLRIS